METTTRLGLKLPGDNDLVDPADFCGNDQMIERYITTLTQAASAYAPSALNLTNQYKTVPFGSIVKTGYAFSLSGGGIRIAEAGFAKVSVHIYANSLPAGDALEVDIRKNGTTFWQYSAEDSDSTYVVFDLVSRLIPVAANDIITMAVRNWQYVRGKIVPESTYMTVDLYKNLNF